MEILFAPIIFFEILDFLYFCAVDLFMQLAFSFWGEITYGEEPACMDIPVYMHAFNVEL